MKLQEVDKPQTLCSERKENFEHKKLFDTSVDGYKYWRASVCRHNARNYFSYMYGWTSKTSCSTDFLITLTSAALEVDGIDAESTAPNSSTDRLADASVLLESLKLVESKNCFLAGCLLLLPDVNTCPLIFLRSAPSNSCNSLEKLADTKKEGKDRKTITK